MFEDSSFSHGYFTSGEIRAKVENKNHIAQSRKFAKMSESLTSYDWDKFKNNIITDTDHCLQYVRRQRASNVDIWLTIHVTNQCLKSWHDFKKRSPQTTNVAILNAFLAEKHAILILDDCEIIEQHLRRLASAAKSNLVGKKGNQYVKLSRTTRKT